MKKRLGIAVLAALITMSIPPVFAKPLEKQVILKKGTNKANLKETFKGYDDVQYTLRAKKGQLLKFKVSSNGNLAYINIFAPGNKPGNAEAILIGSTVGSTGKITLPSNGEYTVQVYQMRNSARRDTVVNFNLDIQILNKAP
ncbi:PPC domain-containing protein [Acinetobacter silvestris]|uniref:DNA breaking-rejoining protein n=1 Tax=Acinetobacter silvestris TaxID=1977882 RepID=A0A1Y3CKH9_9GAMM|nr:PPC domain-containing protein [Acinetobacter silvestris]OTG66389.1 DNA breaking-rejoining protein [Acinetobacter silvestris]